MPSNWLIDTDNGEKAYNLAVQQSPELSQAVKNISSVFSPEAGSLKMSLEGMQTNLENGSTALVGKPAVEDVNLDVYRRLRYQYSTIYANSVNSNSKTNSEAATTTKEDGTTTKEEPAAKSNIAEKLQEMLKPVSSFIGSTTGNLTGLLKSPIGSELSLPKTIQALMNDMNPGLAAKYETCYKKCCTEKLGEMPSTLIGNIQQMLKTASTGQPIPANLIIDIYHGAMDPMKSIRELSENVSMILETFFNNILRNALPDVGRLLDSVVEFSDQLSGLSNTFSGLEQINTITDQLQTYTDKLDDFTQNPFEALTSYLPSDSLGGFSFQNSDRFFEKFIPPDIKNGLDKLQDMSGFNSSGKLGFGLDKYLKGIRGGTLSGIMEGYATQFSMLAPLFTGQPAGSGPTPHNNVADTIQAGKDVLYNLDKLTGQIIKTKPPEPNYPAKEEGKK
jgi:hypothetical protein